MPTRRIRLALALCALPGLTARAMAAPETPADYVSIRLLADEPTEALVRRMARLAPADVLDRDEWPGLEAQTVQTIIERLCGSVQPGYYVVLQEMNNGSAPALDQPVGPLAYSLKWPACVYLTRDPLLINHIAAKGEGATQVMEKLTGYGRLDSARIREFFGTANPRLAEGETVTVRFATLPQFVRRTMPIETMRDLLRDVGQVSVEPVRLTGKIIAPSPDTCDGSGEDYPFRPADIIAAFKFSRAGRYLQPVHVAVVDNGFFGVPCETGDCPARDEQGGYAFRDPFPSMHFDEDRFQDRLGPTLSNTRSALNYPTAGRPAAVDLVSGHGTHIAGLALGGGAFYPSGRTIFRVDESSWLKLIIVKLSEGTLNFPPDAAERMFLLLRAAGHVEVVNLSLAIAQSDGRFLEHLVADANWRNALFVAAAGNDKTEVRLRRELPASLGGPESANVLTIASVDASAKVSEFSNWDRRKVDLAAPGCQISSWLTVQSPPVEASGTSQAAAMVTFGAAMLRALLPQAEPRAVKNRLIYSGSLLHPDHRGKTAHGVEIDLFKALFTRHDYIRSRDASGATRIVAGRLRQMEGLACTDGEPFEWSEFRTFKRDPGGSRIFYVSNNVLKSCPGDLGATIGAAENLGFVEWPKNYSNGTFTGTAPEADIKASEIEEIVIAERPGGN